MRVKYTLCTWSVNLATRNIHIAYHYPKSKECCACNNTPKYNMFKLVTWWHSFCVILSPHFSIINYLELLAKVWVYTNVYLLILITQIISFECIIHLQQGHCVSLIYSCFCFLHHFFLSFLTYVQRHHLFTFAFYSLSSSLISLLNSSFRNTFDLFNHLRAGGKLWPLCSTPFSRYQSRHKQSRTVDWASIGQLWDTRLREASNGLFNSDQSNTTSSVPQPYSDGKSELFFSLVWFFLLLLLLLMSFYFSGRNDQPMIVLSGDWLTDWLIHRR